MLFQVFLAAERAGACQHQIHAEIPPRVEYQITELGRTLSPVFATLVRWSDVHLAAVEAARQDYDAADRRRPV